MTSRAFITGITGQDGSYLAELLLDKGYEVHGLVRPSSTFPTENIDGILDRVHLHYGDMTDGSRLRDIIHGHHFDEIYNLAAQSHVKVSFETAEYTANVIALGTVRLLEAVAAEFGNRPRIYQASSSEMFGNAFTPRSGWTHEDFSGRPLWDRPDAYNEDTPFNPQSPYACAKVFAHQLCQNYRDAYNMHISCGILFNHESERRSPRFVTRKITQGIARIITGQQDALHLGNRHAKRDWGYAPDYVWAMWLMLQQDKPDDYVIATGETHSVTDFIEEALIAADPECRHTIPIGYSREYDRPTEVGHLLGNPSKAQHKLGWEPTVKFKELVQLMMEHDLAVERARVG